MIHFPVDIVDGIHNHPRAGCKKQNIMSDPDKAMV